MPKRVRVCAIFQLCFTSSWILLLFLAPFTGDYWNTRASLLLYETVTGIGEGRFIPQEKLLRHQERFRELPAFIQTRVLDGYRHLEQEAQLPVRRQLERAFRLLTHQEAPFLQIWLLAGMILPVLLLLRKEGSVQAIWLLPVIAACYVLSHSFYSSANPPAADAALFPTEETLREFEDPTAYYSSEYARMQHAWNRYLMMHWSPEGRTESSLEDAEYQFTLARVQAKMAYAQSEIGRDAASRLPFPQRSSLFLGFFLLWHLFFAYTVERAHRLLIKEQSRQVSLSLNSPLRAAHVPSHSTIV